MSELQKFLHETTPAATVNFESLMADLRKDQDDLRQSLELQADLECLLPKIDLNDPELVLAAANTKLESLSLEPIALPSMESVTAQREYAIEGISEILSKIKDYVLEKKEAIGKKLKSAKETFTYAFKGLKERADANLKLLDAGGYKAVEVAVPKLWEQKKFYQNDGKEQDFFKGFSNLTDNVGKLLNHEPFEAMLDKLAKLEAKSVFDLWKAVDATFMVLQKDLGCTVNGHPAFKPKYKNITVRASVPEIAGSCIVFTRKERILGDGKTKVIIPIAGYGVYDGPKIVSRAKIKSIRTLKEAEVHKVLEMVKGVTTDASGINSSLYQIFNRTNSVWEMFVALTEDLQLNSGDVRDLSNALHALINAAIDVSFERISLCKDACNEALRYARLHVK